jgi:hypothetical protein
MLAVLNSKLQDRQQGALPGPCQVAEVALGCWVDQVRTNMLVAGGSINLFLQLQALLRLAGVRILFVFRCHP